MVQEIDRKAKQRHKNDSKHQVLPRYGGGRPRSTGARLGKRHRKMFFCEYVWDDSFEKSFRSDGKRADSGVNEIRYTWYTYAQMLIFNNGTSCGAAEASH